MVCWTLIFSGWCLSDNWYHDHGEVFLDKDMKMDFEPDYNNIVDVALNRRPKRLPLYEHIISPLIMERIMDVEFASLADGDSKDMNEFFRHYCNFFKEMTYDTVSMEVCICAILPDGGALFGGKKGPIQNRSDFEKYPWDDLSKMYWGHAEGLFEALAKNMPEGMKAIGGIGNGAFEISEDLVGLEYLAYMQIDDPELFCDLYSMIGDTMSCIWKRFLEKYADLFSVCRFGDDLGFKSGTLTSPAVIRNNIVPQYKKIIDLVKSKDKPFLLHSCGNIFEVMEDMISIGINAKHSNEDTVSDYEKWIELYSDRIGLFGGIDVDILCGPDPAEIKNTVLEKAAKFRKTAKGYALGSGNSIPDYVPVDGFLAMIEAAKQIRHSEV